MKHMPKRAVLAALTTLAVSASLTIGATNASAINRVGCGDPEFVQLTLHRNGTESSSWCFANGGEWRINFPDWWITRISTGNNRVQWLGDGKWQPAGAINKHTVFIWSNHPGGVRFDGIRIV